MRARLENVFFETVETRVYRYGQLTVEVVVSKSKYEAWVSGNGMERTFLVGVNRDLMSEKGFFWLLKLDFLEKIEMSNASKEELAEGVTA